MKKILLLIVIVLGSQAIYAGGPIKIRAGVIVMPTNMWMLSSGFASLDGVTYTPQFTMNTNAGIAAGIYFTDLIGVEIDVIMGKHKQKFKVENQLPGSEGSFEYTTEISKIDIPVLFKVGGLMYFEVGPQFTSISKVEEVGDGGTEESTEFYNGSQMFFVAGTGASIPIPKIAKIELGLRMGYGFQDLNSGYKDPQSGFELYDGKKLTQAFWGLKIAAVHEF